MIRWAKKLALILGTLLFLEIVLQIAAYCFPKFNYLLLRDQPRWIADAKLGFRPHPLYPEHDANGFRNKKVPKNACLVALGDSQTYGWKVQAFQAWPQQVGSLGQVTAYNMAVPQYGPVHSLVLWNEAERLSPKIIVEGFYTGNDLFDCYEMVYNHGLETELKSDKTEIVQAVKGAGTNFQFDTMPILIAKTPKQSGIKNYVAENSKLYGVFRAVKRAYHFGYVQTEKDIYFADNWQEIKKVATGDPEWWIFDSPQARTVLSVNSRPAALDLKDPRIAEGFRIALQVFLKMQEQALKKNIRFFVLLIPTKELVFKDVIYSHSNSIPARFQMLVQNEESVLSETKTFLAQNQISFIDPLPILRKAIQDGNQPYSISANSHMNSIGHKLVAQEVLRQLEKDSPSLLRSCVKEEGN